MRTAGICFALALFATTSFAGAATTSATTSSRTTSSVLSPEDGRHHWQRIEIEGAQCGNGDTYPIFINQSSLAKSKEARSQKLMFLFEGGGACWNYDGCFESGDVKIHAKAAINADTSPRGVDGIYSGNSSTNTFHDYTKVFLPYCTGDVFLGTHTATYRSEGGEEQQVHHHGRLNVEKTFKWLLSENSPVKFSRTSEVIFYGYSAGAIGTLYHTPRYASHFRFASRKTLLPDGPGLHFAPIFWQKFPMQQIADYKFGIESVGFPFNPNSGLIAGVVPKVCNLLPDWKVGTIQDTRDIVMAIIFGDHWDQEDHYILATGTGGLHQLTLNPLDNCASWSPSLGDHVFLNSNSSLRDDVNGVTPMQFARRVHFGLDMRNHFNPNAIRRERNNRWAIFR